MRISTLVKSSLLLVLTLCFTLSGVMAQERTVTGTVTSSEEGPLPGVNIILKGTSTGTVTDLDGNYSITVPGPDAVLMFSSIGYTTEEIKVGDQTVINVVMTPDITALKEIVVTGYTTQSRRNISSSITSVNTEQLKTLPSSNIAEQLQGRAAGVNVVNSGEPGAPIMLRIRGYGTINNNEPLYIVDGVPVQQWTIADLNPNDVESIQVLKDASAASIYGARAANGVIIITTKTGKATGKTNLSFDGFFGVQTPSNMPDMLDPQGLADVIYAAMDNAGVEISHPQYSRSDGTWGVPDWLIPQGYVGSVDVSDYDFWDPAKRYTKANKTGTKWFDEIFAPAPVQDYNLSATGGSEKGQYALSFGYYDMEGVLKTTYYKRYTLRANTMFNIHDRVRVGETFNISYKEKTGTPGGRRGTGNAISNAFREPEIIPIYDEGGNYAGTGVGGMNNPSNPVAMIQRNRDNIGKSLRLVGSVYLEADILKGLTFKTAFNPNFGITFENVNFNIANFEDSEPSSNHSLNQSSRNSYNWTWYNTLTYNKTFKEDHNLSVLVGTEAINNYSTWFGAGRVKYFSTDLAYRHLDAGEENMTNYGSTDEWSLFSLFAKVDYNYKGKYLVSGTIRRDGSSRFGANNRYGVFPAFSAAWRISDEAFMQGLNWMNDFKIRAGWGQTGNQQIPNYTYVTTFGPSLGIAGYDINGTNTSALVGFHSAQFGNPDVKWEATTTLDIGFDMTLFNNALTLEFDWYKRNTSDMLMGVPLPTTAGIANDPQVNIGEVENKGVDLTVMYNSPEENDFKWGIGLNFSQYKNEVIKLDNPDRKIWGGQYRTFYSTQTAEGHPLGSFFGYKIIGIFQNEEEVINADADHGFTDPASGVGRWKYEDVNGDGVINSDDRTWIGSPHPDFTMGIPLNLAYKGLQLNMFFYGSFGNDLINANKYFTDFVQIFQNSQKGARTLQSWGMPGVDPQTAILPQINQNAPSREVAPSTYMVEDGTYFRMKQLTLGYDFNTRNWTTVERLRIYFQANNLFTISNYTGIDPMVEPSSNHDYDLGVDNGQYPVVKSFMLGVNVTF